MTLTIIVLNVAVFFFGFYFNDEGIRTLRRIESLRSACGINLLGIKMVLHLMNEVERLRAEARFLRG